MTVVQYTFTHIQYTERHKTNNIQNNTKILGECGPCSVFAGYTLAFALQLRKKQGKTSVRVAEECQLYTVYFTLYTSHYALHTLQYALTLYTVYCTLYTSHYALHTLQYALKLYTVYCTLYTSHYALHTLHYALHTLQ